MELSFGTSFNDLIIPIFTEKEIRSKKQLSSVKWPPTLTGQATNPYQVLYGDNVKIIALVSFKEPGGGGVTPQGRKGCSTQYSEVDPYLTP